MRRLVIALALLAAACTSGGATTSTEAPNTQPSVTSTTAAPGHSITAPPGSGSGPIDPLPVIPVGPNGIEYRGGDEIETSGPVAFGVGQDGSIHIVDPVGDRILSFRADGSTAEIDLQSIGVLSAPFMTVASDHLVVVEIFFAPVRERVHRIGFDGSIIRSFELPIGGLLQDGLAGVAVDEADRIHLVIESGIRYLQLDDASRDYTTLDSFTKHGVTVTKGEFDVTVDGTTIPADVSGEFGGLRLLDVAVDGTVVLVREDVVSTSPVTVVMSVEWWTPQGEFVGSAAVDLDAQAIDFAPGLAAAPDGTALVMYARDDVVEVVALDQSAERFLG